MLGRFRPIGMLNRPASGTVVTTAQSWLDHPEDFKQFRRIRFSILRW